MNIKGRLFIISLSCLALSLVILVVACTPHSDEVVYTMGFTPAENAETVTMNAKVVAGLLEKKTGYKFKTYVASDYTGLIEAMRGGQVQFAWLAPFALVLAEKRANAHVLLKAVRWGKSVFYSCIFVRSDRPYKTIQDLKGKTIAWVDPASSSGYIVPKSSLINDGIDPDHFFSKQVFAGGHDTVLMGVLNGSVDSGASFTNEPTGETGPWNMLSNSKPEYKKRIRVIYVTPAIPNETVATTNKFIAEHKEVVDRVTGAITELSSSGEGKKALSDLYRIDSLTPAQSSDFEVLRKAASQLHVDLSKIK